MYEGPENDSITDMDMATPEQWALAEAFFQAHPNETKFSRVSSDKTKVSDAQKAFFEEHGLDQIGHSFIRVGRQIVATEPDVYLGKGGFGAAKRCWTKDNQQFAIKIKIGAPDASDVAEMKILEELGRYYGATQRTKKSPEPQRRRAKKRSSKKPEDEIKHYILQDLIPGINLQKFISGTELTDVSKHIIALQAALSIKYLHDNNIIHGDIAGRNIMINAAGQDINELLSASVTAIDFGLSIKLAENQSLHVIRFEDLPGVNPGVAGAGGFFHGDVVHVDKPLDIYMLGHNLFEKELGITSTFNGKSMQDEDKGKRPSIDEVISGLAEMLNKMQVDVSKIQGIEIANITSENANELLRGILRASSSQIEIPESDILAALEALQAYSDVIDPTARAEGEPSLESVDDKLQELDREIAKLEIEASNLDRRILEIESQERQERRKRRSERNKEGSPEASSRKSPLQLSRPNPKLQKAELVTQVNQVQERLTTLYTEKEKIESRLPKTASPSHRS